MKTLILFLFFFSFQMAQGSSFIEQCKNNEQSEELKEHITALKDRFHAKNCYDLKMKISKMKSVAEIFMTNDMSFWHFGKQTWGRHFPYMFGFWSADKITAEDAPYHPYTVLSDYSLYSEFKNIIHLTYSPEYLYSKTKSLCEFIEYFPFLKQITVYSEELEKEKSDNCISERNIDVIVRNKFEGFKRSPRSKIIGFEDYKDTFSKLNLYPDLQYLGIPNYFDHQGSINTLAKKTNLTHLSMNFQKISDIKNIGKLINVTHLTLAAGFINDINFIKSLKWLESISILGSNLYDLSPLEELKYLKHIEITDNYVEKLPDFSKLPRIESIDLSRNWISSFKLPKNIPTLKNLNLSSNPFKSIEGLENLSSLKVLNLSDTGLISFFNFSKLPKSLQALVANGSQAFGDRRELRRSAGALSKTKVYHQLPFSMYEIFFNYHSIHKANFHVSFSDKTELNLPNLEVLVLNANHLKEIPNLTHLKNLKILKMENNQISSIPRHTKFKSLIYLDLSGNKLEAFPDLSKFKKLRYIDFIGNKISEVTNLSFLPIDNSSIDLSENEIHSFPLLYEENFDASYIYLTKNPLKVGTKDCPIESINYTVSEYCKGNDPNY